MTHAQKRFDHAGKALFEDVNSWVLLSDIFTKVLQDPNLNKIYLLIDALDECVVDLPKLLDLTVQNLSASSRVKLIVSSRNLPNIEEQLEKAEFKVILSLELKVQPVSMAVRVFIQHKVLQLAKLKEYDEKAQHAVVDNLSSNAHDTFLWVALVCESLESISRWRVSKRLKEFPLDLTLSMSEWCSKYVLQRKLIFANGYSVRSPSYTDLSLWKK